MKITRIAAWSVALPLSRPYRLSGGRLKFEALDSTFVRVETDDGLAGWGEGCPWGHTYLPAHGGADARKPHRGRGLTRLTGQAPRLRGISVILSLQLSRRDPACLPLPIS